MHALPCIWRARRKWYVALAAVLVAVLAFLANIDGTVSFFERLLGSGEDSRASAPGAGQVAGPGPLDTTTALPATTIAPQVEGTTPPAELPPAATTIVEQPQTSADTPAPRSVEGWYNLTAYRTLGGGNGFYFVNSIDIGSTSYPDRHPRFLLVLVG